METPFSALIDHDLEQLKKYEIRALNDIDVAVPGMPLHSLVVSVYDFPDPRSGNGIRRST